MKVIKNSKKVIQKIIDNRYLFSLIMIIISAIFGYFINSIELKQWIFCTDRVLSLWWNIKFYSLALASYELFYNIITNKNQSFSVVGTIIILFSGCVQLNFTKIDSLIFGQIIILLIYKILNTKSLKFNILFCLFIVFCSIGYSYSYRPFAVTFSYVFIALIIFELIRNRDLLKNEKNKIVLLVFTLIISIIAVFISNKNIYVSENDKQLSFGISGLYSYLYNVLLPFKNFDNKEMLGSFISIFPIPMLVSLVYLYKNGKHIDFLLPITVVSVLGTIFCISGFPKIIENITMLNGIGDLNVMPAVCLANLYIMFYILSNVEEKLFNMKYMIRITIVMLLFIVLIRYPNNFSNKLYLYFFAGEFTVLSFLFLNYKDKKYQKVLMFFLVVFSLISGLTVNLLVI